MVCTYQLHGINMEMRLSLAMANDELYTLDGSLLRVC